MTEQQTPPTTGAHRQVPEPRGSVDLGPSARTEGLAGWVHFGAVMMMMMVVVGAFGVIEGLVALLNPTV